MQLVLFRCKIAGQIYRLKWQADTQQGEHSPRNVKFPDISPTSCSTPTHAALIHPNPKSCFPVVLIPYSHYCKWSLYKHIQSNEISSFLIQYMPFIRHSLQGASSEIPVVTLLHVTTSVCHPPLVQLSINTGEYMKQCSPTRYFPDIPWQTANS